MKAPRPPIAPAPGGARRRPASRRIGLFGPGTIQAGLARA